ncbi:MAG TPA: GGDEF domain-containing protein [Candidatus Cloacimonadota bacterium]|nr:GGDEF domain-containing protein [Candidatus Cloacimonadota bacterium]
MPECIDLEALANLDPSIAKQIKDLALRLFSIEALELPEYIKMMNILITKEQARADDKELFLKAIAIYFDTAFMHLCGVRRLQESDLYNFLRVLNHLPVLETSPFYTQTLDILSRHFRKNPAVVKHFDRVQMLFLFHELEYDEGFLTLEAELAAQINPSHGHIYTMFQIGRFRYLNSSEKTADRLDLVLNLIFNVYHDQGPESAISLMFMWLSSLHWVKHSPLYKAVLYNLYERINTEQSLNSSAVAYELFDLDARLVDPEAKMELYTHLIQYPPGLLNSIQLRALHFFAGNYQSSDRKKFRESITNFKASNYYLHKCWERLVGVSKYIRTHSNSCTFKISVAFLERKLLHLSHYTSMRNNCYVENLEASFDQIEDLYRQMGELSLTDSLTGLRNRRYQENNLHQLAAFAARHNTPVCYAMLDIDFFKQVNDLHGHAAGDYVLIKLAEIMQKEFRKSDVIIRYGGEEFLIVLFDSELEDAQKILERLKERIATTTFRHESAVIRITVSIGLSCEYFSPGKIDLEMELFIEHADIAMYEAKKSGRNRVNIYSAPAKNPA